MRLFVAVDVNEEVKRKVKEIQRQLEDKDYKIKFVERESLHFTLKFLGDVDEDVKFTCEQIQESLDGVKPFKVSVSGLGYFGSPSYIKVIWVGGQSEELVNIANSLNSRLNTIREDEYDYKPHLTIGRVSLANDKQKLLAKIMSLEDVNVGEVDVNKILLKESVLTPRGPVYTDYKVFNL